MRQCFLTILVFISSVCVLTPRADEVFSQVRSLPLTPTEQRALETAPGKIHGVPLSFTPYNTMQPKRPRRNELLCDRFVYLADDPVAQGVVAFIGQPWQESGTRMRLTLSRPSGGQVSQVEIDQLVSPKLAFRLQLEGLPAGRYLVTATLLNDAALPIPAFEFEKLAKRRDSSTFPVGGVPLVIGPQDAVADGVVPMTTGLPLPRHAAADADEFVLLEDGKPIPAQLTTRANWYPGVPSPKWLGVSFLARYEGGKPRQYTIQRRAAVADPTPTAGQLTVTESADRIVVNTGAIAFEISRPSFAGIESVRLVQADGSLGEPMVSGAGGPFLMDERRVPYSAALQQWSDVTVESAGPIKVTVLATGWYSSQSNERCCIYQTRLTAYAGQPHIDVSQRSVITFDTDKKRLRELGFSLRLTEASTATFGIDGESIDHPLPEAETLWMHQDRHDHLRLGKGDADVLSQGKRSDGWVLLNTKNGWVQLSARHIWQLFPKELEVGRDMLAFHAWPRHGTDTFSTAEETSLQQYHKLLWAHEGPYLDLQFPQEQFDNFQKILAEHPTPTARDGCFLEEQDINALTANAQGTAISSDFRLSFSQARPDSPAAQAALFRQNPGAIPEPTYTGETGALGRFAGKREGEFTEIEYDLDVGYRGYTQSVDVIEDYGMWIWPDTHNNWDIESKLPQTHRWWTNSHYQGVWEATFLYLRSGTPWIKEWADTNYEHFANISTINYHDPAAPLQGHLTGANYHTKGFLPWGSPRHGEYTGDDYVEVGAHFINPDAHLIRYLLYGDQRALGLGRAWFHSLASVALPPERSREACTTLGELVSYYETTWDPQAIFFIHDLARDMNSRPWPEIPAHPGHTFFHTRWVMRYWELTRDPKLWSRMQEWIHSERGGLAGSMKSGPPVIRALLWRETGDASYLTDFLPNLTGRRWGIYDNPDDPLHGFGGGGLYFPTPSVGQTLPYFMQALRDAGLADQMPEPSSATIANPLKPERAAKPANWLRAGETKTDRMVAYLATADGGSLTLRFEPESLRRGKVYYPRVSTLRITDASGKLVAFNQLLHHSQRPDASIVLDPTVNPGPWKLESNTFGRFSWDGETSGIALAASPEAAMAATKTEAK